MKNYLSYVLFLTALLFCIQCGKEDFRLEAEEGEEMSGGSGTIFSVSNNAFSFQHPGLDDQQGLFFFTGNSLFNQNWVTAPASTTARDGIGPLFNARSCSGCHFKDGRGRAPLTQGERVHGLLLRLSTGNDFVLGPMPDPNYGGQLQDLSIQGVNTEADFEITYEEIAGQYPDGTPYSLQKPIYKLFNLQEGNITATEISPRVANQVIGMGLLEAIEESTLLSFADENDLDGDGISGKANYVWNVEAQATTIGRFGWKANQPNVRQQVAAAFSGDMGLTSSIFPENNCPPSIDCNEIPHGGDPEVIDVNFDKVVLYTSSLAVPGRRDWEDKDVLRGKLLFERANCGSCHIPKMTTGQHSTFNAFSNQTIRPYTDMLLHDMGEGLADNSPDFLANGREWRTPPLWGIGLFNIVNGHTNYLHDARARNLEEAILWHGGEAEASKQAFMQMTADERENLIKFLNSL
ncbi:MAG: di-heme oxidoredictase family protein [Bacteroidota bacterium]